MLLIFRKALKMFKNTRILQNQISKKELDGISQFYDAFPHENLIQFYDYTIEKNLLVVTEYFTVDKSSYLTLSLKLFNYFVMKRLRV